MSQGVLICDACDVESDSMKIVRLSVQGDQNMVTIHLCSECAGQHGGTSLVDWLRDILVGRIKRLLRE